MFRKFEKTFRIPTPQYSESSWIRKMMSKDEAKALITGTITIEEKIDGANVGIIRTKDGFRLQKRGSLVDTSEHAQYNRFKAWSQEKYNELLTLPQKYIMYGEFMWATHHIFYDNLPDWFICFDIWDGTEFLKREIKEEICADLNIEIIPLLFQGKIDSLIDLEPYVRGPSQYSTDHAREGIVVKNYRKQTKGKIVVPEFIKEVNEDGTHWTTHWDPRKVNLLAQKEETNECTDNTETGS